MACEISWERPIVVLAKNKISIKNVCFIICSKVTHELNILLLNRCLLKQTEVRLGASLKDLHLIFSLRN